MRSTNFIIFIILVSAGDIMCQLPVEEAQEQMLTMVQMKSKANDAVSDVLNVLNDLGASVEDEEAALRADHQDQESYYATTIGGLQGNANVLCGTYEDATAHREFIEAEIADTAEYLEWITARYVTIDDMINELKMERCESSNVFVLRLREHMEAKNAIDMLRYELESWEQANGQGVNLIEVGELPSYNRLMAYTNMFKAEQLQEFVDLASNQDDDYMGDYMDTDRRDAGDDHVDNTRGEQELESYSSDRSANSAGSVVQQMLVKLDDLEAHLAESMVNLRDNELRASYDTVRYIQLAEKETHFLQTEEDTRNVYTEKLANDLVLAEATEASYMNDCELANSAVDSAKADLETHRTFFMSELDRLAGDEEVVAEIIRIFKQELQGIDDIIRNQVDTGYVVDDDRFSQGMFAGANVDDSAYTGAMNDYTIRDEVAANAL